MQQLREVHLLPQQELAVRGNKFSEKRRREVKSVMKLIDSTYTEGSSVYHTVFNALEKKLSYPELEALHLMLVFSVGNPTDDEKGR